MNGGITPKKLNQSLVDNAATTNTCLWLEDSNDWESSSKQTDYSYGPSKNTHKTIYNQKYRTMKIQRLDNLLILLISDTS